MFFQKLGKSSEITAYYTKYTAVLVNTAKIVKLSAPDRATRASKNIWTSICLKVIQVNCGVRPKHCDIWGTVIPPMYWTVPEWYTIYPKHASDDLGLRIFWKIDKCARLSEKRRGNKRRSCYTPIEKFWGWHGKYRNCPSTDGDIRAPTVFVIPFVWSSHTKDVFRIRHYNN